MKDHGVTQSPKWTRPDAYVEALARHRTARRASREGMRTEPEAPRLLLSTLPFIALIAVMAVMAFVIIISAVPGSQPQPRAPRAAPKQQGVAARGWLQEAQKEFHS